MRGLWAILRRELFGVWVTPLAWVLLTCTLLVQGLAFFSVVLHLSTAPDLGADAGPVQSWYGQSVFVVLVLLFLCPALAMRSFAEERRSGTLEALLTAPVSPAEIVLGKWAALVVTFAAMWAPTLLYWVILRRTGAVDARVVASAQLAVLGLGAAFLAVGVLASALTRSQLVALLTALTVELVLVLLGVGEYVFAPGLLRDLAAHLSVTGLLEEASQGIVDTRRLVLLATLTTLPLWFTVRVVESWRAEG